MLNIFFIIAPLFLIIFGAATAQRFKNFPEEWTKVLNSLALNIGLPALIFTSLTKDTFNFNQNSELILANSAFILSILFITYIFGKILKLETKTLKTLFICIAFSNIGFLGIPILYQLKGESVLPVLSMILGIYVFWIFTAGVGYLEYHNNTRKRDILKKVAIKLCKNQLLITVILSITLSIFQIKIPEMIKTAASMITASVTPVVLVVIGLFIGKSKIGKIKEWLPVGIFSLETLMALPAFFYFGLILFQISPANFSTSIIEAAMPLAITPFALADEYNLHKEFIARSIVISTILSVFTLPFWISLF
ncbi:AEC family transporter [Candidatus Peregrinibacteria bacterium]|nr:AEC family transporter [Candidatus Peregrinibacteria bacterium]